MNNLGLTVTRPSLFSSKGAAAPSPKAGSSHLAEEQPSSKAANAENNSPDYRPLNDLSGLIKRANPEQLRAAVPANSQEMKSRDSATDRQVSRPVKQPGKKPQEVHPGAAQRRQLTVRIDVKTFARLDQMAKSTGQTYQEIQSQAVDEYLLAHKAIKLLKK